MIHLVVGFLDGAMRKAYQPVSWKDA